MSQEQRGRVLVVDDEEWLRIALCRLLETNGLAAEGVGDARCARERISSRQYDLVIIDLRLVDGSGLELLDLAKTQSYSPEVLIITAFATVDSAVDAIKRGAFDYLTKPIDSTRLLVTVDQALDRRGLRAEVARLRKQIGESYGSRQIVFVSTATKRVLELIDAVARSDATVLIRGESGTGKELAARAIHFDGSRCGRPFVAVNCGALPEALVESELFGHVKGAFTGAASDRPGLFEEADGGTIFLDEIADLPLAMQVKLLRVLQDGEVRRVGSNRSQHVDVRVIASTNRDLESLLAAGRFREDLFYRLNVMPIAIPPLRERREDVVPLAHHFLARFSAKLNRKCDGFAPEAMELLLSYDWPGNVRELENVIERTVALTSAPLIAASELKRSLALGGERKEGDCAPEAPGLESTYRHLERDQVLRALHENGWNRSRAAQFLGISRTSLWRKMRSYRIARSSDLP